MNGLTANAAANTIAKFADLNYPCDEAKTFELLTFIQNQIWRSGKFLNSTKFFYVKTLPNGTIITPHGYNVLLGVRIDNRDVDIRGEHFLFHKNGPGDVLTYVSKNMNTDFYDMGESPVLMQPTQQENCCKQFCDNCAKIICVKVPGCEFYDGDSTILISGQDQNGKEIYTYDNVDKPDEPCLCGEEQRQFQSGIDYNVGVKYPLSSKGVMWNNILFSNITNIFKHPSIVPVEIFVVESNGTATKIARLEPYQISSKYRIYQLPPSCVKAHVISGLFKVSKPDPIVHKNQLMFTDNLEALISLAKSFNFKYNKDDMNKSVQFLADGIGQLNSELKESGSNELNPIQISTHHDGFKKFPRF